jgi:hypothetical protein
MPGSIGPKWFGLWPPYNSGSGHATNSNTWILICLTIFINKLFANKQLISVFLLHFSVALAQNTTGVTTTTTMAAAGGNGPLAPHTRPCPLHRHFEWMDDNPLILRMNFLGGVEVVYGPQSAPLFQRWWIATISECFEGHTYPQQPQKLFTN